MRDEGCLDRFYLGGVTSTRGFTDRGAGPREKGFYFFFLLFFFFTFFFFYFFFFFLLFFIYFFFLFFFFFKMLFSFFPLTSHQLTTTHRLCSRRKMDG